MRFPITLLSLSAAASALGQDDPVPQPQLVNITYAGSACPQGGFASSIGPVNATTGAARLSFTMSSFLPAIGNFGSSLKMCDVIGTFVVDKGWKVSVNARGTTAQGLADLRTNATMYLRGTYSFAASAEIQSIGTLEERGPLSGQFAKSLTPETGDKGTVGPCAGGEIDMEFQARAVEDEYEGGLPPPPMKVTRHLSRRATNQTWVLTTDLDITRC